MGLAVLPCYEHGAVSLAVGIVVLAVAVLLGGVAAVFREPARRAMSMIRTFAVMAAASVALFHLLPEAVAAAGWSACVAAVLGALGPIALERALPSPRAQAHEAPAPAMAIGYLAVVAHQAGEGAALAALAETGALTLAIVLAVAAHTVPLAMVVGLRVVDVRRGGAGDHRPAIGLALLGVMAATACGATVGRFIGVMRLQAVQPWLLAVVAGLLLHALSHDALAPPSASMPGRVGDTLAGWAGLALALLGVGQEEWVAHAPTGLLVAGVVLLAAAIAARSLFGRTEARAPQP